MHLPAKVPGQQELELMCDNARRVAQFCDLLAYGDLNASQTAGVVKAIRRGSPEVLTAGHKRQLPAEHDPDVDPYVWDE